MTTVSRNLGCLLLAVTLAPSASLASEEVTIQTLDGTRSGELHEINDEFVLLSAPHGQVTIPLTEVIELRWDRLKESTPTGQGEVIFTDGSIVPYSEGEINDGSLHLHQLGSRDGSINAPIDSIRSWRLPGESTPTSQAHWQSICAKNRATDLLALRRRDSESMDPVEGIIKACHADGVQFEYEGEPVTVPWKRVYGLVFFQQVAESMGDVAIVHGPGKLRLKATQFKANAPLLWLGSSKWQARLSLAAIRKIDLSAGKTQRLSEATVLESSWKPYLQLSTTGGPPQRNVAFDGGPLRLRFPDKRVDDVWRIQTFHDGWALRSQSHVALKLEPWARRLRGWVGIDPATARTGSAEVTILADGKTLLSLHIDGNTAPEEISLSVEGVQQLTLRVDYGENLDTGDNVHFVDLRVTR